jgi:hypothetical protein
MKILSAVLTHFSLEKRLSNRENCVRNAQVATKPCLSFDVGFRKSLPPVSATLRGKDKVFAVRTSGLSRRQSSGKRPLYTSAKATGLERANLPIPSTGIDSDATSRALQSFAWQGDTSSALRHPTLFSGEWAEDTKCWRRVSLKNLKNSKIAV